MWFNHHKPKCKKRKPHVDKPWFNEACKRKYTEWITALSNFNENKSNDNHKILVDKKRNYKRFEVKLKRQYMRYAGDLCGGPNPTYLQVRAVYVQKRGQKLVVRTWWVLRPYGFGSTQTRRSTFRVWETFSAFTLRSDYGFTQVRVTCVLSTGNERITHLLREFFILFRQSLATRTAYLSRACCVRDKYVVCAYSALLQFYCQMSKQNSRGQYRVSTCPALITHVVCSAVYIRVAPMDDFQHFVSKMPNK